MNVYNVWCNVVLQRFDSITGHHQVYNSVHARCKSRSRVIIRYTTVCMLGVRADHGLTKGKASAPKYCWHEE